MWRKLKKTFEDQVTSKKFQAAAGMVLGIMQNDTVPGLAVSEKSMIAIVATVITYIYAQGEADAGKEAAKIAVKP